MEIEGVKLLCEIGAARVMPDVKVSEDEINDEIYLRIPRLNRQYRFLLVDNMNMPWASKDGKNWCICLSVFRNGKERDARTLNPLNLRKWNVCTGLPSTRRSLVR